MNESDTAGSTIPTWHAFMKPLLEVMSDGRQWPSRALKEAVCDHVGGHVPLSGGFSFPRDDQLVAV